MPAKRITLSMTEYHEKLLNTLAKKRGLGKSDLVRRLIEDAVITEECKDRIALADNAGQ